MVLLPSSKLFPSLATSFAPVRAETPAVQLVAQPKLNPTLTQARQARHDGAEISTLIHDDWLGILRQTYKPIISLLIKSILSFSRIYEVDVFYLIFSASILEIERLKCRNA